jgi:hypothetical protein
LHARSVRTGSTSATQNAGRSTATHVHGTEVLDGSQGVADIPSPRGMRCTPFGEVPAVTDTVRYGVADTAGRTQRHGGVGSRDTIKQPACVPGARLQWPGYRNSGFQEQRATSHDRRAVLAYSFRSPSLLAITAQSEMRMVRLRCFGCDIRENTIPKMMESKRTAVSECKATRRAGNQHSPVARAPKPMVCCTSVAYINAER